MRVEIFIYVREISSRGLAKPDAQMAYIRRVMFVITGHKFDQYYVDDIKLNDQIYRCALTI